MKSILNLELVKHRRCSGLVIVTVHIILFCNLSVFIYLHSHFLLTGQFFVVSNCIFRKAVFHDCLPSCLELPSRIVIVWVQQSLLTVFFEKTRLLENVVQRRLEQKMVLLVLCTTVAVVIAILGMFTWD